MTDHTYRILAIDDHPIVLQGIQALATNLNDVSCTTRTNLRLEDLPDSTDFDLCILDLGLCGKQSKDFITRLHARMPSCRILVYTMHEEPWIADELIELDVEGAVSKNSSLDELQRAIGQLRGGLTYYGIRPPDASQGVEPAHHAGNASAEAHHERPEQRPDCPSHEPQHQHRQDPPAEDHEEIRGRQRHTADEQNQSVKSSTTSTGQWSDP